MPRYAETSRRYLRPGMFDISGQRVLQVCPGCRRDWHRARDTCRRCGTPLPPPWTPGPAPPAAEAAVAPAHVPTDEPDPEQEAQSSPRDTPAVLQWVWLASGLVHMRQAEAHTAAATHREVATLRAMVEELIRELP